MRISRVDVAALLTRLKELEHSAEMLWEFVETSTQAIWCIEWTRPVDLNCPDDEIIRQVFDNECTWRMCNSAMARLYDLPPGMDLNQQPVGAYFSRGPENEAFVREIIESGYSIDDVPSMDRRHDGSVLYLENSVRCHIRDGRLHRMHGTSRNVTDQTRARRELLRREHGIRGVLNAVPEPILVLDREGVLLTANPAFETVLGWDIETWIGRDIGAIADLGRHLPQLAEAEVPASLRLRLPVRCGDGLARFCEASIAVISEGDQQGRFVAVLRIAGEVQVEEEPASAPPQAAASARRRRNA